MYRILRKHRYYIHQLVRQMKYKVEFAYNSPIAGLAVLMNMQQVMQEVGVDKIKSITKKLFSKGVA